MNKQVCAVVVSHNPGKRIDLVIESLIPQVGHIVIVDNASGDDKRQILRHFREKFADKIHLILNDTNRWLSGGLNDGIRYAMEHDYNYVLEMNDGNFISQSAVSTMLNVITTYSDPPIGIVTPSVILGDSAIEKLTDTRLLDMDLVATAGALVPIEVYRIVGLHDESFLIDFDDFEFSLRVFNAGYRVVSLPAVYVACELGSPSRKKFLWREVHCHNYSPLRRYYFARNGLALLRRTHNIHLYKFYYNFLSTEVAKIILYESDKLAKLTMTMRGIRDALVNRLGAYKP